MRKSFSTDWKAIWREPKTAARAVLGVLLAANLVAVWFVYQTPGGSVESLRTDIAEARKGIAARRQAIERLNKLVEKSEGARKAGDQFIGTYFLDRRHAYSELEATLSEAAKNAGVRPRERSYNYEPIEGSETMGMVTITSNFEGNYADLIQFVNQVDRSKRLLIIDSMAAQPQQQGQGVLAINVKMNAFFREEGQQ